MHPMADSHHWDRMIAGKKLSILVPELSLHSCISTSSALVLATTILLLSLVASKGCALETA